MKLKKVTLYKYSLPLIKPLKMKGSRQDCRDGLIVELTDENGAQGFGDAAPFPGLHTETLVDIISEFKTIHPYLSTLDYDDHTEIFSQFDQLNHRSPSLQFAIDWAICDLVSKARKINPARLISSNSNDKIFVNALLAGSPSEMLEEAEKLKFSNYKTIKMKVAKHAIDEEINLVLKLNNLFEGEKSLRLDANQCWTLKQATAFGKGVQEANIEYIEEPCSSPELCANFFNETGLAYAFDETLSQNNFGEIKIFNGLKAIIIKPSLIGRIVDIKKWGDWAKQNNLKIVFSSAFESGIGLRAISHLASALGEKNVAHGLDTFRWLKEDVTIPAFSSESSFIQATKLSFHLNENRLNKVYEYDL